MILILIFFFILGSAIGSFLNVVIDRTIRRETLLGRSYCDHCHATLKTVDLVPIFSFVGLGGRCRVCKKPVSWQYPIVEAIAGILFVISFLVLSAAGNLAIASLLFNFFLVSILIIVAVVDIKFSLIPTSFIYLASLLALIYNFIFLNQGVFIQNVGTAFLAALVFGLIVLATRGKGMGTGDITLAFLMGLVLGFGQMVLAVFLAFFSGALVSVFLIILGKKHFGQTIPFAPFLVLGFFIGLFWGKQILQWYLMVY
ncbi:hypothetical protein A2W32_02860 [candidate division WWE3 bacterium RBG_16_37_10]|uniref:Prepilin peptidase n=1 Tax=candidate division WWE3 bacterium RBG_16_37_10 TaxID=1802610 RepID=A0A1F4UVS0_UNCKA|nr:MAG: hypothetical protein A2W32_02860 [candidate division WWE3 bacterium RBG_16_37_10]